MRTTQRMTTVYSIQDIEKSKHISYQKYYGIPLNSTITIIDGIKINLIPLSIHKYNKSIERSDTNI